MPNSAFFKAYSIFLFLGGIVYFSFSEDILLKFFNSNHTKFFNYFFIGSSGIAETYGIIIVLLILLFRKYSLAVITSVSLIVNTIIINLIKQWTDLPRPLKFYENSHEITLNLVKGVDVHSFMSFPSGHTAAGIILFFSLSLLSENKVYKVICFILAMCVAFSRVYLLQHFFRDIYFGSIFGIVILLIMLFIFQKFDWYNKLDELGGLLSKRKTAKNN